MTGIHATHRIIFEARYLRFSPEEASRFFQATVQQNERGSIITSSRATYLFRNGTRRFADDAIITAAVLDRLLQHAHVAMIGGENFRLRDRKQAGITLPRSKAEPEAGQI